MLSPWIQGLVRNQAVGDLEAQTPMMNRLSLSKSFAVVSLILAVHLGCHAQGTASATRLTSFPLLVDSAGRPDIELAYSTRLAEWRGTHEPSQFITFTLEEG